MNKVNKTKPYNLVIMESAAKSKTVQTYLGKKYKVVCTGGHINNLSYRGQYRMGIDLENFEPFYKLDKEKIDLVNKFKKLVLKANEILIATDHDREGEAIGVHLKNVLQLSDDNTYRIIFNEITKEAILNSIKHKRTLDYDLFAAQEARRMIDRMIGFRLSKLLRTKINSRSAGRVQSVALKMVVERENIIINFKKVPNWKVTGIYNSYSVELNKYKGRTPHFRTPLAVKKFAQSLNPDFIVQSSISKTALKKRPIPLRTSSLLQDANSSFGFSTKKTAFLAQKLYEGVEINGKKTGLITYPRTDSLRISSSFVKKTQAFIKDKYGDKYLKSWFKIIESKKNKNKIQDAHEGIRITDPYLTPEVIKKVLGGAQLKLYTRIYNRTIATLMADAKINNHEIKFKNNDAIFVSRTKTIEFDGFLKQYIPTKEKYRKFAVIKIGSKYKFKTLTATETFSKSKPRFSEASLVKMLEEKGIGRPSTYSNIFYILQQRGYITNLNRSICPTKKGMMTLEMLNDYFGDIINEEYTANMEINLDTIAQGYADRKSLVSNFWKIFAPKVIIAFDKMPIVPTEKANMECPRCKSDLVFRYGRYGQFIACSAFPKCKYIYQKPVSDKKCPKCKKGDLILKSSLRRKNLFIGCSLFKVNKCDYLAPYVKPKEVVIETKVINILELIQNSNET